MNVVKEISDWLKNEDVNNGKVYKILFEVANDFETHKKLIPILISIFEEYELHSIIKIANFLNSNAPNFAKPQYQIFSRIPSKEEITEILQISQSQTINPLYSSSKIITLLYSAANIASAREMYQPYTPHSLAMFEAARKLAKSIGAESVLYAEMADIFDYLSDETQRQTARDICSHFTHRSFEDGIPSVGHFLSVACYSSQRNTCVAGLYSILTVLASKRQPLPDICESILYIYYAKIYRGTSIPRLVSDCLLKYKELIPVEMRARRAFECACLFGLISDEIYYEAFRTFFSTHIDAIISNSESFQSLALIDALKKYHPDMIEFDQITNQIVLNCGDI